jgi:hypothetical protein
MKPMGRHHLTSHVVHRSTRSRFAVMALVVVPVVLAIVVALMVASGGGDGGGDGDIDGDVSGSDSTEVVDLEAVDVVSVSSVADMVASSECVLRGEVVHTDRGRALSGDLVSRLVQVRVDDALAGECPTGTVVVEEEGWLPDGTEVTVEGWPGSREGDEGVWFLVSGRSDELPYAATVVAAGAPRWRDGHSMAPDSIPMWLADALADGPEGLAEHVRTLG